MNAMKLFITISAISALNRIVGCDFHEAPLIEGDFRSTHFLVGLGHGSDARIANVPVDVEIELVRK